jgi:hypothetical protein
VPRVALENLYYDLNILYWSLTIKNKLYLLDFYIVSSNLK